MSARAAIAILVVTLPLAGLGAQSARKATEKELIIQTLKELRIQFGPFRDRLHPWDPSQSLDWLTKQAGAWFSRRPDEVLGLRRALQSAHLAMGRAIKSEPADITVIREIAEDLWIKGEHCRQLGLAAEQKVEVKTKREGIEEVRGLEVWYLEKFRASEPGAVPHRFKGFSSPANDSLVPGRYLFWAKHPSNKKAGERTEQRVGVALGQSEKTISIEVLAP